MKKKLCVVSIPVHEKPEVIKDQIENLKKYLKEPAIVLHVSKSYFEKYKIEDISNIPDVYINPVHLTTGWADIIHTHICNFNYIKDVLDFDYFVMHSSNDMYIRKGFDDYMKQYEAGFNVRKVVARYSHWWPGDAAFRDEQLKKIMALCGQTMIVASQIEGSFYKKELMEKIVSYIEAGFDRDAVTEKYSREEVYFSTIASNLVSWDKIGRPTTYSEVHYFDRTVWKWRERTRKTVRRFLPQKAYDRFEMMCNNRIFAMKFYRISPKVIRNILENKNGQVDKNRYLNDGSGMFELYDGNNIFSVKRIERDYNNKVRKFIRNLAD